LIAFTLRGHTGCVDDDVINGESRSVLGQHVDMPLRRKPGGFTGFGGKIQHDRAAGGR
jgi:hypothetical protein